MCAKILSTILWLSSLLMPHGRAIGAAQDHEPAIFTVFFAAEGEQFAFTQKSEGAEFTVISRGVIRERHTGQLGPEAVRSLEHLFTEALAGRGRPAGEAIDRDDAVGPDFHYVAAGGLQWAANDRAPAPAMVALLEWVRQHGPALPAAPHEGLYLIGYPIAQTPPGTPVEKDHPSPEIAAATARPFGLVRVTDPAKQRGLPHVESEFTIEVRGGQKFEIYYVAGAPFSLDKFLAPAK